MAKNSYARLSLLAVGCCLIGCGWADPDESVDKAVGDLSSVLPSVRKRAAFTLDHTPNRMPEVVPLLENALNDPDEEVRIWMVLAFLHHTTEKKKALPMLVEMLKSTNDSVRSSAAAGIGGLGPDGSSAAPALAQALKEDPNPYVRRAAAITLSEIKPDPAVVMPALLKGLDEKGTDVPWFSAEALGKLGSKAKEAVPVLLAILKNSSSSSYDLSSAARALGEIGASAESAVPVLMSLMSHQDLGVRRDAIRAIGGIGQHPDSSVPALAKALTDPDVRVAAAQALGSFAGSDEARAALEPYQNDADKRFRFIVQDSLRSLEKK